MFSQLVRRVMEQERMLTAPPHSTVAQVARQMASSDAGAVLVVDNENLVGIFTERDALFRVIAHGLDPQMTPLGEVMTPTPITVGPDSTFGYALQLMHERRCRHLPVLEQGTLVGIVSARDAMDPELEEFVCEAQRRVSIRR